MFNLPNRNINWFKSIALLVEVVTCCSTAVIHALVSPAGWASQHYISCRSNGWMSSHSSEVFWQDFTHWVTTSQYHHITVLRGSLQKNCKNLVWLYGRGESSLFWINLHEEKIFEIHSFLGPGGSASFYWIISK